jgi:Lrp/AsnC family transcriptional regulator, leucine-responsive regulatory protein
MPGGSLSVAPRWLRARNARWTQDSCGASLPVVDERDRRILDLFRHDAWLTYAQLARYVHLSASAVQRRVEKLIADGVLLGAVARVADNRDTLIYVLVELRDDARGTVRGFTESLRASGLVESAHYVTGESDVVVTLRVSGVPEYAAFFEKRLNDDPRVRRVRTLTSLRRLI